MELYNARCKFCREAAVAYISPYNEALGYNIIRPQSHLSSRKGESEREGGGEEKEIERGRERHKYRNKQRNRKREKL